jgi:hypothetical protein
MVLILFVAAVLTLAAVSGHEWSVMECWYDADDGEGLVEAIGTFGLGVYRWDGEQMISYEYTLGSDDFSMDLSMRDAHTHGSGVVVWIVLQLVLVFCTGMFILLQLHTENDKARTYAITLLLAFLTTYCCAQSLQLWGLGHIAARHIAVGECHDLVNDSDGYCFILQAFSLAVLVCMTSVMAYDRTGGVPGFRALLRGVKSDLSGGSFVDLARDQDYKAATDTVGTLTSTLTSTLVTKVTGGYESIDEREDLDNETASTIRDIDL